MNTSLSQNSCKRFSGKRNPKGSAVNKRSQSQTFGANRHCRLFIPNRSSSVFIEIGQDGLKLGDRYTPVEVYQIGCISTGKFKMLQKSRSDRFENTETIFSTAAKCGVEINRLLAIANKLAESVNVPTDRGGGRLQIQLQKKKKKKLSRVKFR